MIKKISTGEWNPNNHFKHEIINVKDLTKCDNKGKTICLKSSYESKAIKILENDLNVAYYIYEPFDITYINSEEKERSYIPDFLAKHVDGSTLLIEVKPQRLMDRIRDNQLKQNSCEIYCNLKGWKYELWTEEQLNYI